jgi:hypothetical protein
MTGSSRNDVQKAWLSSVSQVLQREHDLTEVRAAWLCIDPLDSLLVDKRNTPHENPLKAHRVRERKQAPSACAHATTRPPGARVRACMYPVWAEFGSGKWPSRSFSGARGLEASGLTAGFGCGEIVHIGIM